MSQTIEISRAVHLLGIKRSQLQNLIKSGDLHTFEGKLDLKELIACFPAMAIDDNTFENELEFLKRAAYSNRVQEATLPSKEELNTQLHKARIKLLVEQQKSAKYLETIQELLNFITVLRLNATLSEKSVIDKISQWVLRCMNSKP